MKKPVITDSTCLIGLERISHLEILPALFEPVLIPPEVRREFGVSLPWLTVKTPSDQMFVTALKMLVDDGEAEAIALAREHGWQIILDDHQARAVGKRLGITIIGTVAVLVLAKRHGIISSVATLLDELMSNGFYISNALKEEALRLVGE